MPRDRPAGGRFAPDYLFKPSPAHPENPKRKLKQTKNKRLIHTQIKHQTASRSPDRALPRSPRTEAPCRLQRDGSRARRQDDRQSRRGGEARDQGVRDVPGGRRRLLEGRGGSGQGPAQGRVGVPAGGGRAARRAGVPPPHPRLAGLHRPRDRACVPAREPDAVRHGLLRHQLLQAPHLGVRGVRADGVPGRGHPGVREHRRAVRAREGPLLRGDGLLLREDVEPHPAVQDRLLPAVPRQGRVAGRRARPPAVALLQRRHVRARAQHGHRQGPARHAPRDPTHPLRGAGLPEHVLPGAVQADPARVQPGAGHAVEAPRERAAGEGEGGALLRGGVEAVEVHGQGGQHGPGGHQDACQEVVGHLQRRDPGLQGPAGRRRRRGGGGGQEADPRGAGGGRHGQVRHRAVGRLIPALRPAWSSEHKKDLTTRPFFSFRVLFPDELLGCLISDQFRSLWVCELTIPFQV